MIGPLKNLFGGKKENFFLDLDNTAPSAAPAAESAPPAPAVAEVAVPAAPEKAAKKPVAKKPAAKKKVEKQAADPAAPATPVAPAVPPKPVVLFAPDNLAPQPNGSRRRPGPSLNNFKDMAKTMGGRR